MLQESRGEGQPGPGHRVRPALAQLRRAGDARHAARIPDHPVREPVDVEYLDPGPDRLIRDEQGQLGFECVRQVAGEGGQQNQGPAERLAPAPASRSARKAARCRAVTVFPVPAPPVTWAGPA